MSHELINFLRECLDDDEKAAREALKKTTTTKRWINDEWAEFTKQPAEWRRSVWTPTRVLAEVDAKRRTLVRCEEEMLSGIPRLVHFAQQTLREMALPYAEHLGYEAVARQ